PARIIHRPLAIVKTLIPIGRPSQDRSWIARAEGADNHVPYFFGILQHDEFVDARGINSHLRTGRLGIANEARLEGRIDPGASNEFRAIGRRACLLVFNLALNVLISDYALFEQQIPNRIDAFRIETKLMLRVLVTMTLRRLGWLMIIAHGATLLVRR